MHRERSVAADHRSSGGWHVVNYRGSVFNSSRRNFPGNVEFQFPQDRRYQSRAFTREKYPSEADAGVGNYFFRCFN
jgi:hypothetical protein